MAKDSLGQVLGEDKRRMDDTEEQLGTIDVSTYFEVPRSVVTAATGNIRVDFRNWIGSDMFILGHPDHGVLGTDFLGSTVNSFNLVREIESRLFFDIDEDFTSVARANLNDTTASGWGTGSIVFSAGDRLQTISLVDDIELSTTNMNHVQYIPTGSFIHLGNGSFSNDGGSNWTGVNPNKEIILPTVGSEVLFRLDDPTGSVEYTSIQFIIKQSDY